MAAPFGHWPRVPSKHGDWWNWHSLREGGGVRPVNQRVAAAQGTEQVVLVACWRRHGQEVVFTCLSFCHVWTLGRTSDFLVWLEPKIFFYIISL